MGRTSDKSWRLRVPQRAAADRLVTTPPFSISIGRRVLHHIAAVDCGETGMMAKSGDEEMADFTAIYVRRALEPRLQGHGKIDVRKTGLWGFTIVHRYTSEWNGRQVALPVAQLRPKGQKLQLYWKRANGRWVPYEAGEQRPFVGSLEACLKEIDHDRWGCFWG